GPAHLVHGPPTLVGPFLPATPAPGLGPAADVLGVTDPRILAIRGVDAARVIPPGHVRTPLPFGRRVAIEIPPTTGLSCKGDAGIGPGRRPLGPSDRGGHGVCSPGMGWNIPSMGRGASRDAGPLRLPSHDSGRRYVDRLIGGFFTAGKSDRPCGPRVGPGG